MEDNMHASTSGVRAECENSGHMEDMVGDALGVNLSYEGGGEEKIIPSNKALKFYSMMDEVNKLFHLTRSYQCVAFSCQIKLECTQRLLGVLLKNDVGCDSCKRQLANKLL
jgi:hypothetical protein